jgi:arylsulfatase A
LVVKERTTELFDMNTDPSQQRDIAALQPDITKQLHEDYLRWFEETSRGVNPQLTISLGAKHTRTELPVYEATFGGNLRFKEGHGWAHDWLTNWLSPQDTIVWEVESPRPERVKIAMTYTCPTASLGATVRVVVGSQSVSRRITRAFDPPVLPSPDRVPRKEAYEKPWTQLLIGSVVLPKGKSKIILTAPQVARLSVAEVKSIILTKY